MKWFRETPSWLWWSLSACLWLSFFALGILGGRFRESPLQFPIVITAVIDGLFAVLMTLLAVISLFRKKR